MPNQNQALNLVQEQLFDTTTTTTPSEETKIEIKQEATSGFDKFPLPLAIKKSLEALNFTTPTEIQAKSIPVALNGRDILGSSQTGSGKTGAFGIPLVARLMLNPNESALVMAPTRELATQVADVLSKIIPQNNNIRRALLIGGDSMFKQIQQLKRAPRIIIGTPGRIMDHIKRKMINLSQIKYLVLDETDRMLDIGMGEQIEEIVARIPEDRQTLLFSATFSPEIIKISQRYLKNPERISVGESNQVAKKIKQESLEIRNSEKYSELTKQLSARDGSVIIFVKTKIGADDLSDRLNADGFKADAIHGDLQQRKRERVITSFRNKNCRILVATDVAARGLDIPHIEHVINFDLPQCPEDYIHRIGRTARAGAEGNALSFISPDERKRWYAIQALIDPESAKNRKVANYDDVSRRRFSNKNRGSFGGGRRSNDRFQDRNQDRNFDRNPERSQNREFNNNYNDSPRKPRGENRDFRENREFRDYNSSSEGGRNEGNSGFRRSENSPRRSRDDNFSNPSNSYSPRKPRGFRDNNRRDEFSSRRDIGNKPF
ncbi:MAG: DEAD/DEAH box helicase [Rickettsiales bacterium]|nr:DEAD/DEAH box helicase [Rickettsiales bacterium]